MTDQSLAPGSRNTTLRRDGPLSHYALFQLADDDLTPGPYLGADLCGSRLRTAQLSSIGLPVIVAPDAYIGRGGSLTHDLGEEGARNRPLFRATLGASSSACSFCLIQRTDASLASKRQQLRNC
jgi:hypothetical protein